MKAERGGATIGELGCRLATQKPTLWSNAFQAEWKGGDFYNEDNNHNSNDNVNNNSKDNDHNAATNLMV